MSLFLLISKCFLISPVISSQNCWLFKIVQLTFPILVNFPISLCYWFLISLHCDSNFSPFTPFLIFTPKSYTLYRFVSFWLYRLVLCPMTVVYLCPSYTQQECLLCCYWLYLLLDLFTFTLGFPGGSDAKRLCLQCSILGFNPWVRKIPLRRK